MCKNCYLENVDNIVESWGCGTVEDTIKKMETVLADLKEERYGIKEAVAYLRTAQKMIEEKRNG